MEQIKMFGSVLFGNNFQMMRKCNCKISSVGRSGLSDHEIHKYFRYPLYTFRFCLEIINV